MNPPQNPLRSCTSPGRISGTVFQYIFTVCLPCCLFLQEAALEALTSIVQNLASTTEASGHSNGPCIT